MRILDFFRSPRLLETPPESSPVDTAELEQSCKLLQATVEDVSKAALDAVKVLSKKYGKDTAREKIWFSMLNKASDAVALIDSNSNVFFCNDQFVQAFGYDSYMEVLNHQLVDVLPSTFSKFESMWECVQQNQTWSKRCPKIGMMITVVPIMNGESRPIYYICTFKSTKTHK